jgi:prepilin signal peptidase PulO-like enzyme (type II secretory pathway)
MIILVLVLLGLCLGSFTNALVWRIHEQTKAKSKADKAKLSITKGRSMCTHCHHVLGFWDLVPVVSWVMLNGKCRYCHKPIQDTPLAELLTPALFVASYAFWPFGWSNLGIAQFAAWLMVLTGFVALTLYDMRWQILPSRIIYPLGVLAAAQVVVLTIAGRDWRVAAGAALGVLCLGGLFYGLFQISGGRWIGGGDVRLGVVIGLLVGGPSQAVLVLFLASLLGTVVSLPSMVTKKSRLTKKVAFGPFLIVATVIVYLFGGSIINWYKTRFLLL